MSEPVAWRWIADHKYLCASEPEEPFKHQWEPLYPADAIERKDAAIDELVGALYACLPHLPTEKYYGARDVIAKYDIPNGPDFEDGCSLEGFVGGCERMGCHSKDGL